MVKHIQYIFLLVVFILFFPSCSFAYTTNMSASVVVGQADFTHGSANQGGSVAANTLNAPRPFIFDSKLFIADVGNNRVLIYNSIPTSNNASADVVIGQPDFTSSSANQGGSPAANTLSSPQSVFVFNGKLIIPDFSNHRVLIYNSIPTSNNASADVVIGQVDFTHNSADQGQVGVTAANFLNQPTSAIVVGGKLLISNLSSNKVLVFNSIPTSNNASADVVIGQSVFTIGHPNQNIGIASAAGRGLSNPRGLSTDGTKLFISDTSNNRLLIFNSVPTANNASADVVIGQQNFTSGSSNQGGSVAANTLSNVRVSATDGTRLFVPDMGNNRVLIYNTIPTSNNASADLVIGQSNFTSSSANQGDGVTANSISAPSYVWYYNNKLLVGENNNNRILIFENVIQSPTLSLSNSVSDGVNGAARMNGVVSLPTGSSYSLSSVLFSINGGGWSNVTASDGNIRDSLSENFYFDFFSNSNNNSEPGFTTRVKAVNTNLDVTDNVFFFQPFQLDNPKNNSFTKDTLPSFSFTVNHGRFQDLKDNLSKYQLLINPNNKGWQTYIDNIPISYDAVYNSNDNLKKSSSVNNGNGEFEDKYKYISFSNNSSNLTIKSKPVGSDGSVSDKSIDNGGKILPKGAYQWKIVAIDKSGNHTQESNSFTLLVNSYQSISTQSEFFPLTLLSITGLNHLNLSNLQPEKVKSSYSIYSTVPTFTGIARSNAQVSLSLSDTSCNSAQTICVPQIFTTTVNENSRFKITIPKKAITFGKSYSALLTTSLGSSYAEIPSFTLQIGGVKTSSQSVVEPQKVKEEIKKTVLATPTPTSSFVSPLPSVGAPNIPEKPAPPVEKKYCLAWICWKGKPFFNIF